MAEGACDALAGTWTLILKKRKEKKREEKISFRLLSQSAHMSGVGLGRNFSPVVSFMSQEGWSCVLV